MMTMPLEEQPISVIFGGMHGSPRNIAKTFHDDGHKVVVVDKREKPDDDAPPFYDHAIAADLMDAKSLPGVASRISSLFGRVTNLVFGLRYRGPAETAWDGEIALGLTLPRIMIDALVPSFTKGGAIVFMTSTAARFVAPSISLAYQCAKAATDQMTRYYAFHLGAKGIRVNAIAPGYIVKDESMAFFTRDRDKAARIVKDQPLGRVGRAQELATVTRFLCSEDASFVTGQIIDVDGGICVQQPGAGNW